MRLFPSPIAILIVSQIWLSLGSGYIRFNNIKLATGDVKLINA